MSDAINKVYVKKRLSSSSSLGHASCFHLRHHWYHGSSWFTLTTASIFLCCSWRSYLCRVSRKPNSRGIRCMFEYTWGLPNPSTKQQRVCIYFFKSLNWPRLSKFWTMDHFKHCVLLRRAFISSTLPLLFSKRWRCGWRCRRGSNTTVQLTGVMTPLPPSATCIHPSPFLWPTLSIKENNQTNKNSEQSSWSIRMESISERGLLHVKRVIQ